MSGSAATFGLAALAAPFTAGAYTHRPPVWTGRPRPRRPLPVGTVKWAKMTRQARRQFNRKRTRVNTDG